MPLKSSGTDGVGLSGTSTGVVIIRGSDGSDEDPFWFSIVTHTIYVYYPINRYIESEGLVGIIGQIRTSILCWGISKALISA